MPFVIRVHVPFEVEPLDSSTKVLAAKGQESNTVGPERAILKTGAALETGTPSRMVLFEWSTINRRPWHPSPGPKAC